MPKVCSQKSCKRVAEGKFKLCVKCRDRRKQNHRRRKDKAAKAMTREGCKYCSKCYKEFSCSKFKMCQKCRQKNVQRGKKRRERTAKATAKEGHKHCYQCSKEYPLSHFKSSHSRRTKPVTTCATCRIAQAKSQKKKNTKVGMCNQVFLNWKANKCCELCGYTGVAIEADHRGSKTHGCSDIYWWAWNGGPEALKKELSSCRPLCRFCHRLISQKERGVQMRKCTLKKQAYVHKIKIKIGECHVCKLKVDSIERCCGFDFDHVNPETKIEMISNMVQSYSLAAFFNNIEDEVNKCRLLCANCHLLHTKKQSETKRLKLKNLLESEENKVC